MFKIKFEFSFDWNFWSKFLESYQIVAMKLTKLDPDTIEMFDFDQKRVKFNQNGWN